MSALASVLGLLFGFLGDMGSKWLDKQKAVADGKVEIAISRAKAMSQIQLSKANAEIEWENSMANASNKSWKDELWTIFFVTILTAAFIPGMEDPIKNGFIIISELPDWFGYAVMLAISAAFGKNVVSDFKSLKYAATKPPVTTNPDEVSIEGIDKRE